MCSIKWAPTKLPLRWPIAPIPSLKGKRAAFVTIAAFPEVKDHRVRLAKTANLAPLESLVSLVSLAVLRQFASHRLRRFASHAHLVHQDPPALQENLVFLADLEAPEILEKMAALAPPALKVPLDRLVNQELTAPLAMQVNRLSLPHLLLVMPDPKDLLAHKDHPAPMAVPALTVNLAVLDRKDLPVPTANQAVRARMARQAPKAHPDLLDSPAFARNIALSTEESSSRMACDDKSKSLSTAFLLCKFQNLFFFAQFQKIHFSIDFMLSFLHILRISCKSAIN